MPRLRQIVPLTAAFGAVVAVLLWAHESDNNEDTPVVDAEHLVSPDSAQVAKLQNSTPEENSTMSSEERVLAFLKILDGLTNNIPEGFITEWGLTAEEVLMVLEQSGLFSEPEPEEWGLLRRDVPHDYPNPLDLADLSPELEGFLTDAEWTGWYLRSEENADGLEIKGRRVAINTKTNEAALIIVTQGPDRLEDGSLRQRSEVFVQTGPADLAHHLLIDAYDPSYVIPEGLFETTLIEDIPSKWSIATITDANGQVMRDLHNIYWEGASIEYRPSRIIYDLTGEGHLYKAFWETTPNSALQYFEYDPGSGQYIFRRSTETWPNVVEWMLDQGITPENMTFPPSLPAPSP